MESYIFYFLFRSYCSYFVLIITVDNWSRHSALPDTHRGYVNVLKKESEDLLSSPSPQRERH